ncbi:class I SAM-dependent methyltransferase [Candidatus Protochlamydia sp. W-9]|uniref:class I SAM-dependent methyltransferase n=1 Tax=Candidatus Protochlamydia sp. W-9 TaxID=1785087 RepID=UPI00096A5758|nr:class I SAM-dependent methyltransferase [Candidatus Protochlamydia sp. W-9]
MINATASQSTSLPTQIADVCSGNHKKRLLIGEGNFSFALALINKHDKKNIHSPEKSLAHSITATELNDKIHCSDCKSVRIFSDETEETYTCENCKITLERIEELKNKGVRVELGINGTKIHEIEEFKNTRFRRIHWNCPHDGKSYKNQTLPPIIQKFFKSCAKVQKTGDRVHITLAQPTEKARFYQVCIYDITYAASSASYVILKKRKFDKERYPEYEHVMTGTNETAIVTEQGLREFVFKKVSQESFREAIKQVKVKYKKNYSDKFTEQLIVMNSEKQCQVASADFFIGNKEVCRDYFCCSTDEDSSDYDDLPN